MDSTVMVLPGGGGGRTGMDGGARLAIISMNGSQRGGLTGTGTGEVAVDLDAGRLRHMTSNMSLQSQEGASPMRARMTMESLP